MIIKSSLFAMDTLSLFSNPIFLSLSIISISLIFATKSFKKRPLFTSLLKKLSSARTLSLHSKSKDERLVFVQSSFTEKEVNLPSQFQWPEEDLVPAKEYLDAPVIDLSDFLRGDDSATAIAIEMVQKSCVDHGFFHVTNHGVDPELIHAAEEELDLTMKLPLDEKMRLKKTPGDTAGYSGAHADRFQSKLPWKETVTFNHRGKGSHNDVLDYVKNGLGEDFEHTGSVYQKYCEEMNKLGMVLLELLAISLGVDREHFKKFYEDNNSMLRCNMYPPCKNPGLTLGTGPHTDPTSLTILHQDQVGGLEVFTDNKWQSVRPQPNTFVVNIGDTFTALTNGIYKSALHRALVNTEKRRISIAYFLNPNFEKVVKPPQELVLRQGTRKYPDFTWSDLLSFTQFHYRSDGRTLQSFVEWFQSPDNANPNRN